MILKGTRARPFFVLLYGVPKIGKTHLASLAPTPVFIDVEEGAAQFDVSYVQGPIDTNERLTQATREVYKEKSFETVIIDSVTAVERIFVAHLLKENNWVSLETPGYGKGHAAVVGMWLHFLSVCETLRNSGKNVILIGHQRIRPVNDPLVDSYDRIELDVTKNASSAIMAATDAVLYYRWKTRVKKGENGKKSVGVSSGDREIYTQERAGFNAGNRFGLDLCIENPDDSFWKKLKKEPNNGVES